MNFSVPQGLYSALPFFTPYKGNSFYHVPEISSPHPIPFPVAATENFLCTLLSVISDDTFKSHQLIRQAQHMLSSYYHFFFSSTNNQRKDYKATQITFNVSISKIDVRHLFVLCTAEISRPKDPVTSLKRSERHTLSLFDLNAGELCWVFLQGGDDSSNWKAARNQSVHRQVCEHWNGAKSLLVGQLSWCNSEEHGIKCSRACAN